MNPDLILSLISIFLLILCSGFFSGSETGLTAVSRSKIHKLKTAGNKRAAMVSRLHKNKDSLIGTILLGNNAVNILASALATSIAIRMYGDEGVIYATIIMTLFVLIFAEVFPKTYALYNAEKIALAASPVLLFLVKFLSPFTNMIQVIVNSFMKLLGIVPQNEEILSVDDLKGTIDLHHHEGEVVKGEKDMLRSILDLSEIEVEDIMVHRKNIYSVDASKPATEIITSILDSQFTRIPLWKGKPDNIVGILHVKALLKALRSYEGDIDAIDIMSIASEPWFVPETNSLNNQLFQFRAKRNHIAIVVDEYGALVGIVTLEDVLEEIVGQIDDEHDNVNKDIRKLKDGSYRIKGDVTIRDVNRQLDWDLPDSYATTIAGLIIHDAETIPEVASEFNFHGFWFKIEKKEENQITSILVKKE